MADGLMIFGATRSRAAIVSSGLTYCTSCADSCSAGLGPRATDCEVLGVTDGDTEDAGVVGDQGEAPATIMSAMEFPPGRWVLDSAGRADLEGQPG